MLRRRAWDDPGQGRAVLGRRAAANARAGARARATGFGAEKVGIKPGRCEYGMRARRVGRCGRGAFETRVMLRPNLIQTMMAIGLG